jgi:hypothetical protein
MNLFLRLRKSNYRSFVHPTREVNAIIERHGLRQQFYAQTLVRQVVVYAR